MAIAIYRKNELSSGFVGIIVRVRINSEPNQYYLSYRKKVSSKGSGKTRYIMMNRDEKKIVMERAKKLNEELLRKQIAEKKKRRLKVISGNNATKIVGIRPNINITKNKHSGNNYLFSFFVRFQREGKFSQKRFYLTSYQTYSECWEAAVIYYAKALNLAIVKELIERKPDKQVFHELAKNYRDRGHDIPPFRIRG